MAAFKSLYLIHGDDHGRVGERRARLRALAEAQGDGGVELLEGDASTPEAVAASLMTMTFAMGRRFIIVDGVERWKDAAVTEHLLPVLATPDPDVTVAFFAREDGRLKVPAALVKAVTAGGGDIAHEKSKSAKELPAWVAEQARRLGIELDRDGAQTLVAYVGERQQRLLRELEKLALEHGQGARLHADDVEAAVADGAEKQVWGLGDALVAGNLEQAMHTWLQLREREAFERLLPLMVRRMRDVHVIAVRLEAGEAPAQIKASTKGNPYAVDRRIAEARRADADRLARGVELLAALERDSRGDSELRSDTLALRALTSIAG